VRLGEQLKLLLEKQATRVFAELGYTPAEARDAKREGTLVLGSGAETAPSINLYSHLVSGPRRIGRSGLGPRATPRSMRRVSVAFELAPVAREARSG